MVLYEIPEKYADAFFIFQVIMAVVVGIFIFSTWRKMR